MNACWTRAMTDQQELYNEVVLGIKPKKPLPLPSRPCPFCNSKATITFSEKDYGPFCGPTQYRVMCNDCRSKTGPQDTPEEAADLWDSRYLQDD